MDCTASNMSHWRSSSSGEERLFKMTRSFVIAILPVTLPYRFGNVNSSCCTRIICDFGSGVELIREKRRVESSGKVELECNCALAVYSRCSEEAKRAVLCWLWLSRAKNVMKDIRLLIADLIWSEGATWSEQLQYSDSVLKLTDVHNNGVAWKKRKV